MRAFSLPRARGFTLIELMIALLLGLIVIGAIGAVFLSSSRTYRTTESLSRLQENARFAVQFISREVQLAGYADAFQRGIVGDGLIYPADSVFSSVGQVIVGNRVNTSTLAGTDSIEIRYGGSDIAPLRDCLGNQLATSAFVTVRLYVNTNNQLSCSINGANAESLVDGIADMTIEYGVSDAVDFMSASDLAAAPVSWVDVVSVKVTLAVLGDAATTGNRKIASVTALRNQLP